MGKRSRKAFSVEVTCEPRPKEKKQQLGKEHGMSTLGAKAPSWKPGMLRDRKESRGAEAC